MKMIKLLFIKDIYFHQKKINIKLKKTEIS